MLFVRAGLTPEEAWAAATTTAGASLRQPGLGTLREGAPADLLILDRDPTRDLAALSTLRAVIADGRLYSRETLEAALAAQRRHFDGPVFARTAAWTARAAVEIGRRANGALSTAR